MTPSFPTPSNLSGALVVAHPGLFDPNFRRTVVLISSHTDEDGAIGTILNRSLGKSLGEFDPEFAGEPLGEVPLHEGGPVAAAELVFLAWKWSPEESVFRLAYGIDPEHARRLLAEGGYEVRAFLGYAGWGKGQLEEEIAHQSWVVSTVDNERLEEKDGTRLWKKIVAEVSPAMKVQAEAPEDPGLN